LSKLARHYQRSANTAKALEYLGRAGQQALQRSSHAEALGLFTSALELLQPLPDTSQRLEQELALQLGLGAAVIVIKGWSAAETGQVFARARELCRRIGETPQLFPVLLGLFAYYDCRGEMEPTRELAMQIWSLAQSTEDAALLPWAHNHMGQAFCWAGEPIRGKRHFELACSIYDPDKYPSHLVRYSGPDIKVHSLGNLGSALWLLGFPEQAVDRAARAVTLARELADSSFTLCDALITASVTYYSCGETAAALTLADEGLELAHEQGFQLFVALGIAQRGAVLITGGHAEEGITELREGLDEVRACGFDGMLAYFLAALAAGYGIVGRVDEGIGALAEAMALAESTGTRFWEPELYRLKGELTLKRPEAVSNSTIREEAESCFRQAIEIARRQSAKSFELRATTSLARLLVKQGRNDEARTMLAEIYNWFTEGFDTADLKGAKALLDELSV
jgi:predicted ATPase